MVTEFPFTDDETNTVAYFSAKTLPELQTMVNHNMQEFKKRKDGTDKEVVYYSELEGYLQFLNGEYVQAVTFNSFRRTRRIVARKNPTKANKTIAKPEKTASSLQPMET